MNWNLVEKWNNRSNKFSVEVSHHCEQKISSFDDCYDGRHRWCVYIYIFPDHPKFKEFVDDSMYSSATDNIPFHGGCTFNRPVFDADGVKQYIKVGCDYNHYGDVLYTYMDTKEAAYSVFADAEQLYNYMIGYKNDI